MAATVGRRGIFMAALGLSLLVHCAGGDYVDSLLRGETPFAAHLPAMTERFVSGLDHHRTITERWTPNLLAAMSLYPMDAQYNTNCLTHLLSIGTAVQSFKMWAIKMLDAFGKPGSYILRGNNIWAGSYSVCLEAEPETTFKPSYCWVNLEIEHLPNISMGVGSASSFPIRTAICMPDSCPGEELFKIFQHVPEILNLPFYTDHINVTGVECVKPDSGPFIEDTWAVIAISVMLSVFLLLAMGTAAEYYLDYMEREYSYNAEKPGDAGYFWEFLLAFSVPRNYNTITNMNPSDNGLTTVHGLRALFVIWAIVANTYFFSLITTDNILDFLDASEGKFIQILLKFSLGMDGLFFLSGLGITFYFLTISDEKHSEGRVVVEFFIRILRYWVPYMGLLLLFNCSLGKYMGGGPFWPTLVANTEKCSEDWWQNFAYINNFWETEGQCMRHAWYMALDMQYFLLLPLILVPLVRWAPMGLILAAIVQGVSMTITGLLTYNKNLPIMIYLKNDRPGVGAYDSYMDLLYVKPYYHIGSSLTGVLCGWTLFKLRCQADIKKGWVIVGWVIAAACFSFALFGNTLGQTDVYSSVFYHTTKEIAFGLGLFWLLLACTTGHGGIVNWFLNLPFFSPLGRISYCAFLVHGGWILLTFLNNEKPRHFSFTLLNCLSVSNIVVSFALGLVLSLSSEAPIVNLKQYFVGTTPSYKRLETSPIKECNSEAAP